MEIFSAVVQLFPTKTTTKKKAKNLAPGLLYIFPGLLV